MSKDHFRNSQAAMAALGAGRSAPVSDMSRKAVATANFNDSAINAPASPISGSKYVVSSDAPTNLHGPTSCSDCVTYSTVLHFNDRLDGPCDLTDQSCNVMSLMKHKLPKPRQHLSAEG